MHYMVSLKNKHEFMFTMNFTMTVVTNGNKDEMDRTNFLLIASFCYGDYEMVI